MTMPHRPIDSAARRQLLLAGALLPLAVAARGASPTTPSAVAAVPWQRIRFARRGGTRVLRGQLQGAAHGAHDYLVRARAGQVLEVELETLAPGASFQVLAPHGTQALFMSEFAALPLWRGHLPADGDYRVRVSLNPVPRSRGETLRFTLRLTLGDA